MNGMPIKNMGKIHPQVAGVDGGRRRRRRRKENVKEGYCVKELMING